MKAIKFLLMALCSSIAMFSIVSCDKKDDNGNNGTNSNKVKVYLGVIDEESMNMYDIILKAYNGANCEVVALTKESTKLNEQFSQKYATNVRTISIAKVNGHADVDSVVAVVTPKSNIEEYIGSKDPTASYMMVASGNIIEAVPGDNGFAQIDMDADFHTTSTRWGKMLLEGAQGQVIYVRTALSLAFYLSGKK